MPNAYSSRCLTHVSNNIATHNFLNFLYALKKKNLLTFLYFQKNYRPFFLDSIEQLNITDFLYSNIPMHNIVFIQVGILKGLSH